jgi:hypothetical protein
MEVSKPEVSAGRWQQATSGLTWVHHLLAIAAIMAALLALSAKRSGI